MGRAYVFTRHCDQSEENQISFTGNNCIKMIYMPLCSGALMLV